MVNFSEPVGLRDNFNGLQVGLGVGWLFGKGTDDAIGGLVIGESMNSPIHQLANSHVSAGPRMRMMAAAMRRHSVCSRVSSRRPFGVSV